jgi:hypothetical protein
MEQTILTEEHPVIEKILNTNKIDDETKLLAISALQALEESGLIWRDRARRAKDVDDIFEWYNSDLGVGFWVGIQDDVFDDGKRSC